MASGCRYVAETEFIRAYCMVQNCEGDSARLAPSSTVFVSTEITAIGEFTTDWYGHRFAQDWCPLPPLNPGESAEMTFFSLVHKDETQPNGRY